MPSTVESLFASAGLHPTGPVLFGEPVPEHGRGVYVVAHTSDPRAAAPPGGYRVGFGLPDVEHWLGLAADLTLDGRRPTAVEVCDRMREFWLPDEPVLYIGQTGRDVGRRLRQYYRTELGQRRPHAGGYWLKTLAGYRRTYVFWASAPTGEPEDVEARMLTAFVENVSPQTRSLLRDPSRPFPFANLEHPRGNVKNHGISHPHLRD